MPIDVISLLIFIGCIVLFIWDKLPMATSAILGCVLMVIFGVADFKTVFGQFASNTVILTIGVMIIGAAISEVGLAEIIGKWIVRISKGSEIKLMIATYIVAAVMSAFLTNSAVLAMFIPIIMGVSKANPKIKAKNLIMPITFACIIGGASTLVGSTQQMTTQGLLEEAGEKTFGIFDFSLVGGILALLGLVYCLLIGRKRGEKIWGGREDIEDTDRFRIKSETPNYDVKRMIVMAFIFVAMVILYITEWVPLAVTSTLAALLCIITGCISQKKAVSSVNWDVVGRLGACLGIAKALISSGGSALVGKWFQQIVGDNISPYLLFCILILMVQITGELITDSTAIVMVLPIVISLAPRLGLNTYAYALGITMAVAVGYSTPLGSSTLGMAMSAGYKFRDFFRYSIWFDILAYLTIIITVPLIYGLTV